MTSQHLQLALWVVQPVLLSAVAIVMFRRRIYDQFPGFLGYCIAQVGIFAASFPIYLLGKTDAYFIIFWCSTALSLALQFKIIHEIFLDIFRPYHALKDLGTLLFKWAALVMILISVISVVVSPVRDGPILREILLLQRCMRVIQCGMVLLLFAFCSHLRVSWKRRSFGIALGFGLLAAGDLISFALFSGGHISFGILNLTTMGSYNAGVLVWLGYPIFNLRESAAVVLIPQRWDTALVELQPHAEPESLIPMFEHMVDRALSRTQDRHA